MFQLYFLLLSDKTETETKTANTHKTKVSFVNDEIYPTIE